MGFHVTWKLMVSPHQRTWMNQWTIQNWFPKNHLSRGHLGHWQKGRKHQSSDFSAGVHVTFQLGSDSDRHLGNAAGQEGAFLLQRRQCRDVSWRIVTSTKAVWNVLVARRAKVIIFFDAKLSLAMSGSGTQGNYIYTKLKNKQRQNCQPWSASFSLH